MGGQATRRPGFFLTAMRLSARSNLQYRGHHLINNVASAIFGFIYIAIWAAVAAGRTLDGVYDTALLTNYVVVNQCLLWLTTFDRSGIKLARRVRDGSIGIDLMRPVGLMRLHLAQNYGGRLYNLFFRSAVLALIYALAGGFPVPSDPARWPLILLAVGLATHIGTVMTYLIGLSGFWTVETSWLYLGFMTMSLFFGGASIPLDLLPAGLGRLALATPFACMGYYPSAIYLGIRGPLGLIPMVGWAVAVTALAAYLTRAARRRADVVGG